MATIPSQKTLTLGEGGLALTFAITALLCLIGAAKAQDAPFAFHAYLGAAASIAAVFTIF
ncbi:MAG TPA: cytochrome C oxidase, partial [Xanthobacteraceae bacterium]|nr:cytochrome C oxidase [Xanthobacteraceae bacterium]